jgi:hypothetical protein
MLNTAFDSNAAPSQRITSLLMGLTMILPVLSMVMGLVTKEVDKNTIATNLNVLTEKMKNGEAKSTWSATR